MPSKKENNPRGNSRESANKKPSSSTGGGNRSGSSTGSEGLDDVTYNVITVLHEKSKGLEAYEQYIQDVEGNDEVREIFEELREQDREAVSRLEECLRNLISGESGEEEEEDVA